MRRLDIRDRGVGALASPAFEEFAPDAFLHQLCTRAEQRALDLWVLENALLDVSTVNRSAQKPLVLNVNACARHFDSSRSASAFAEVICRSDCDPQSIVIELTETYALNDPVRAAAHIERLERLRVRFPDVPAATPPPGVAAPRTLIDASSVSRIALVSQLLPAGCPKRLWRRRR